MAAVAALEDAGEAGGRIDRLRVKRVDDERGHLPVAAVSAMAAHGGVHHAPAAPAVQALDHAAVRPGVDGLWVPRVDRDRRHVLLRQTAFAPRQLAPPSVLLRTPRPVAA